MLAEWAAKPYTPAHNIEYIVNCLHLFRLLRAHLLVSLFTVVSSIIVLFYILLILLLITLISNSISKYNLFFNLDNSSRFIKFHLSLILIYLFFSNFPSLSLV